MVYNSIRVNIDTVARNLKYYRKKNNLTIKEVASFLNICPMDYLMFEDGEVFINVPMLGYLANLYSVSTDTLIYSNPKKQDWFK